MCGIYCYILKKGCCSSPINGDVRKNLLRRGKDFNSNLTVSINGTHVYFESWVLHMRGEEIGTQPVSTADGNILIWNGEIYDGLEIDERNSDTSILVKTLNKLKTKYEVLELLSQLEGPWSIIFFHQPTNQLYFGRDYFGRRSLLCRSNLNGFELSSVASFCNSDVDFAWHEVPSDGIYSLNMSSLDLKMICYPWKSFISHDLKCKKDFHEQFEVFQSEIILTTVMERKYQTISKKFQDLPKVSFTSDNPFCVLQNYLDVEGRSDLCDEFIAKFKKSVCKRVLCHERKTDSVAILFSGGIDCTFIALLVHQLLPENIQIDLLNVAFEKKSTTNKFDVPDRLTGLSTLKELQFLCPRRKWCFVKIDVEIEELKRLRPERIADLTYPKKTVLDDSIACAVWFASRGKGKLLDETPYSSSSKLLLCGMGADEQLGGYSRYRGIFQNTNDLSQVKKEIEIDVERISSRNLGRDDRVISDHTKEARFPFLDEDFVSFLNQLPLHLKVDFDLPRGVGEKLLLRAAAYKCGLRNCASLPKRAIQFGSRVAKCENRKEKGNEECLRLNKLVI